MFEKVEKNLIDPIDYLDYPKYELNDNEFEKVSHGMSIKYNGIIDQESSIIILVKNKKLIAVGQHSSNYIKCLKVLL